MSIKVFSILRVDAYLSILFAYATFSRLNRGYTQPKFAPVFAQTCHGKFTCCHRVAAVLNFSPCFVSRRPGHSGRKMRNRRLAPVIVGEICPRCPDKVFFFFFFFFFHTDKFIEPHYLQYKGNNNTIPTILTKKKKKNLRYITLQSHTYKTYKTIC